MGGVLAEANIRGGGEYGEAWHLAGTRSHKQNVFDDFIAAAEYLISEKYTNPKRLAIHGRSNGGLLVRRGARAAAGSVWARALPTVGVLDMLRYHTASANARQWSTDYGLSENAEDFKAQLAYSPVHNVKEGRAIRRRWSRRPITTIGWFPGIASSSRRRCRRHRAARTRC